MSQQWRFLALAVELGEQELRGLLLAAAHADDLAIESDGRRTLVWIWRGPRTAPGARRLGAVWLKHSAAGGTVEQMAWDPQVGDQARLWSRFERLAPGALVRPGAAV